MRPYGTNISSASQALILLNLSLVTVCDVKKEMTNTTNIKLY